jgi:hemerythrin-like domain-containing protein
MQQEPCLAIRCWARPVLSVRASEEFAAGAKVLKDLVEHHAEEEETEMFPRARKLMGRGELLELVRPWLPA